MASPNQQICRIIFACLFIFQCHSSSSDLDDRVSVSLYYESLCPYCANFIVNQLVKLFVTDLGSIVNLRLIPWGNTQTALNNAWICQHGPDECLLDVVQACAINVWPNQEMHFRLVYCIERLQVENRHGEWNSCFAATGLSELPVRDCFNNGVGIRIEQGYGDETASLNPPHRIMTTLKLISAELIGETEFPRLASHYQLKPIWSRHQVTPLKFVFENNPKFQ
nr:gamma-interferon-inducible lysosomal thiol reductase-like [Ipomoea trifida]